MIAVAITVHDEYMRFLPDAIRSIERQQRPPDSVFVLCDGAELVPVVRGMVPPRWAVHGATKAGTPNPLRAFAYREVLRHRPRGEGRGCWVVYLDADDTLPPAYLASIDEDARHLGAQYPSMMFGPHGPESLRRAPAYNFWTLRRRNYVPTTSAWNAEALKEVFAWSAPTACLDDYTAALAVTRAGWELAPMPCVLALDRLGDRHHLVGDGRQLSHCLNGRRFAAITLFRGSDNCMDEFLACARRMLQYSRPPMFRWQWCVDSRAPSSFMRKMGDEALALMDETGISVSITRQPYVNASPNAFGVQQRVAAGYNKAIGDAMTAPGGCDWVLLWEDDNMPPANALTEMCASWEFAWRMAGMSPVYLSRHNDENTARRRLPSAVVVATKSETRRWNCNIRLADVEAASAKEKLWEVGGIAGGFSLYNPGHLSWCLPITVDEYDEKLRCPVGWDGDLSWKLRTVADGRVYLHTELFAEHRCY